MAKQRKRGLTRPITLPIRTLSGGVGRQAPSKRLPTEAENLDNCFVTLEKSVEKRNGFEIVSRSDSSYDGLDLLGTEDQDFFTFWLQVSDRLRYLVLLDFKATDYTSTLIYVYKLTASGLSSIAVTYVPSESERSYLTFGSEAFTARESLRVVNVGANVIVLNKNVKAGFSSGEEGFKFDLNGNITDVEDVKGGKDVYLTSVKVDPEGIAIPWNSYGSFIKGDEVIYTDDKVYRLELDYISGDSVPHDFSSATHTFLRNAERIDVRDYTYPVTNKAYLGQSLNNISETKFPPSEEDLQASNGAENKLLNNYPTIGDGQGRGKVYYYGNSFGAVSPGYYRVKSTDERPYLHKILTPESASRLDEDRMPHKIFIGGDGAWKITPIDWDSRLGGTNDSNPGISVFKDTEGNVRQANISSMAFYRDRLFMSSLDTIFSSTMGDFTDFWIEDPSNIVATDPIDVQASANKFTPIISMVPFSDFLFINTDSDVQYELLGSENQITPFTAELAPTSFYSTALMIEPQLMGSQIYFYARNRMYLYFSNRVNNLNKAVEVSSHCPQYLPTNFRSPAVAPSRDSIFVVDDDSPNLVYGYTNRFSGDQVVQNAFYRFVLDEGTVVYDIQEFDDNLYLLLTYPTTTNTNRFHLVKMKMATEDPEIPRIDSRIKFVVESDGDSPNTVYNEDTNQTTFTLPISSPNLNECILHSGWGNDNFSRLVATLSEEDSTDQRSVYVLEGNYSTQGNIIYFGSSFTMTVELSPQFMRDENNNVVDGVLNLRTLHLRHAKTGDYRIEASRRGRDPVVSTFNLQEADNRLDPLPLEIYETDGEFVAQVFGFASETSIKILSDYPTPVNITQMELKGKFKSIHSTALT